LYLILKDPFNEETNFANKIVIVTRTERLEVWDKMFNLSSKTIRIPLLLCSCKNKNDINKVITNY